MNKKTKLSMLIAIASVILIIGSILIYNYFIANKKEKVITTTTQDGKILTTTTTQQPTIKDTIVGIIVFLIFIGFVGLILYLQILRFKVALKSPFIGAPIYGPPPAIIY